MPNQQRSTLGRRRAKLYVKREADVLRYLFLTSLLDFGRALLGLFFAFRADILICPEYVQKFGGMGKKAGLFLWGGLP